MNEIESYRLIQDGQPVAWVEGLSAVADITYYAAVCVQDGPVIIQKKVNGRWKLWTENKAAIAAALQETEQ